MLFLLKKFVTFWLMPLPFCLTLLLLGASLLRWSRRKTLGRTLAIASIVLLMLFSNHFVSRWLARPLETRYAPIPELPAGQPIPAALAACRYVAVLGGGNGYTRNAAATHDLSLSALARITEAVRLLRVLPDAQLIVSGPSDGKHPAHAVTLARAAISLGIDERRITLVDQALDTEDEARIIRQHVGDAPFALVTSAWHMPRAMALFRHQGLAPLPCPADFTTHDEDTGAFSQWLWDAKALENSTAAVHERLGYLWIWLRGRG
jgi:uncharacterized SAM-binding protein YcdF (DUF218 family)